MMTAHLIVDGEEVASAPVAADGCVMIGVPKGVGPAKEGAEVEIRHNGLIAFTVVVSPTLRGNLGDIINVTGVDFK